MSSLISSAGMSASVSTLAIHSIFSALMGPYGFLTPILGQVLGTAFGGSLQTVSSSLSPF